MHNAVTMDNEVLSSAKGLVPVGYGEDEKRLLLYDYSKDRLFIYDIAEKKIEKMKEIGSIEPVYYDSVERKLYFSDVKIKYFVLKNYIFLFMTSSGIRNFRLVQILLSEGAVWLGYGKKITSATVLKLPNTSFSRDCGWLKLRGITKQKNHEALSLIDNGMGRPVFERLFKNRCHGCQRTGNVYQ